MNYLRGGLGSSRKSDEAAEIGKPLTPRSERPLVTLGMLQLSMQNLEGLCKVERKCVLKDGHTVPCWPAP